MLHLTQTFGAIFPYTSYALTRVLASGLCMLQTLLALKWPKLRLAELLASAAEDGSLQRALAEVFVPEMADDEKAWMISCLILMVEHGRTWSNMVEHGRTAYWHLSFRRKCCVCS